MLNKFCIDCGKKVSRLGTIRCQKCYGPYLSKLTKGKKKNPEYIKSISGKNSPFWKGGRYVDFYGYVKVRNKEHPKSHNGYVAEHVLVVEKQLGRFLQKGEEIHHLDGNKQNNDIKNLKLFINHSKHLVFEHKQGKRRAK